MENQNNSRKARHKRRLRIRRILIAGVLALTLIISILAIYFFKKSPEPPVGNEQPPVLPQTPEEKTPLTEGELQLLDDYQLVLAMLDQQDMSSYDETFVNEVQALRADVTTKIESQTLAGLEEAINTLAAKLDSVWFTGEHEALFYSRGLLILNKQHAAPAHFEPGDRDVMMAAFESMKQAAVNDGINLYAFSRYRSYWTQDSLYNRYVAADGVEAADRYSAKPGFSEHQTGYAMDIGGDNEGLWAEDDFMYTAEAEWLAQHAHEYGFILRYQQGKEHITGYMFESWHFRYVGPIAGKVYQSGLTLEEYLGLV